MTSVAANSSPGLSMKELSTNFSALVSCGVGVLEEHTGYCVRSKDI